MTSDPYNVRARIYRAIEAILDRDIALAASILNDLLRELDPEVVRS